MAAATQVIYQNQEGAQVWWAYDDVTLAVSACHVSNPAGAPTLALRVSIRGGVRTQTVLPGVSTNILLAQSPAATRGTDRHGNPAIIFSGIDFVGGSVSGA